MSKIFILTGPVKSYKTTKLLKWSKSNKNVLGILQPVIDKKRYLKNLKDGNLKLLEADNLIRKDKVISVGNFRFDMDAFSWAKSELAKAWEERPDWLIIDEYGKLEINNKGLEPIVTKIIKNRNLNNSTKIIVVIRDYLISSFLSKFNLSDEDFEHLDI